jgi:glycosyltransferase involved in cell wall biosynthesis
MATLFYLFRDAPQRRAALGLPAGSPGRYALYGLDQLVARGHTVRHNLEGPAPAAWARLFGAALKRPLERAGGYGGDFATVLASLRRLNSADAVLSTVDTVGIPLMLLARARVVRRPFAYVAIGLPERLARLRSARMERLYAQALGSAAAVVAYSRHEADAVAGWLRERGVEARVEFVPFGVDADAFRPVDVAPDFDVVSIGADPHRDFELLMAVARSLPDVRFLVVASAEQARALGERPPNVSVDTDLPFDQMRDRLERARVVALPVRDNSYSGATTVLLQAMALAKPIVVTRTAAIARGYGLADGENVRLVAPGDAASLANAVGDVLRDDGDARAMGLRARAKVKESLDWERYVGQVSGLLDAVAHGRRDTGR